MRTKILFCLLALVALVGTSCTRGDNPEIDPDASVSPTATEKSSVKITSPTEGDEIKGNTVEIGLEHTGIEIAKAGEGNPKVTGHFHVFIDRDPVAEGETIEKTEGIVHSTDNPIIIAGLEPGEHRFVVVLGDTNHVRKGSSESEVRVKLTGPSVQATAPDQIAADKEFTITLETTGLEVVKAPAGEQGKAGHFHILIDLGFPEYAKAIATGDNIIHTTEKTIKIKGLPAGDHKILIVVGDGGHVPFRPLVADLLVIKVA